MAKHFSPDTTEQEEALFQGKIMDEYAASRVGHQFGNYRLIRLLGQGGFADVYLGEHLYLKTHAALKVLRLQLTNNALEDFLHEARTIARLEHPHIVRVLECGVERGTPFLVMNYAPNGTLRQHYARGSRLPLAVVVSYVQQIASALDYAHHAKLIHRDVKPENMLLGRAKEVLLSDFGLVLIAQSSRSQTMKEMAGTIPYMAPEQLQGKPRPASDQYALGIVVYEWLAGERPFQGTFAEIASQHLLTPPPSLHQRLPDIPPALENVVLKALAKDSQGRFASVQEFALALEQAIPTVQRPLIRTPLTPPPPSIVLQSTDEMDLAVSPSVSFPLISTPLPMDGSSQPLSMVTSSGTHQPLTDTASFWTQSLQPMSTIAPPSLSSQPTMSIPVDSSLSTRILTPSDQSTIQVGPSLLSNPSLVDSRSPNSEPASQTPLPGAFTPEQKPKRRGSVKARAIGVIVLALVVILGSVGFLLVSRLSGTTTGITGTSSVNQSQTTSAKPTSTTPIATSQPTQQPTHEPTALPVQRQVSAQVSQSNTVNATGTGTIAATKAQGMLTIPEGRPYDRVWTSGTTLTDNNGIAVVILQTVDIPANSSATVPAEAVNAGASGNIPANDFFLFGDGQAATNAAPFTGGKDAQNYTFVQQSDIDGAASQLKSATTQQAVANLQNQLQSNEHFVGNPKCTSNVTSNHIAGDKATEVTVTVTRICKGIAST